MTDPLVENVERVRRATPSQHSLRHYERLSLLGAMQHGLVARWQLKRLGIGDTTIAAWVESKRLIRVRRGVCAVGHKPQTTEARWLAAVLAVGPGTVLSHADGLALCGLRDPQEDRRIQVTTTRRGARDQRGIRVFTARGLVEEDVQVVRGIPVTTLARGIYDASAVSRRADVVRDLDKAFSAGKLTDAQLDAVAHRARGRRGKGPGRFAAARAEVARLGVHLTRSEVERLVVGICDEYGLPRPVMNHEADGYEIDIAFVGPRVGVEIDSFGFHGDRESFVRDRRKIRRLQAAGWRMLSFAAVDIRDDRAGFARDLGVALRQRAAA